MRTIVVFFIVGAVLLVSIIIGARRVSSLEQQSALSGDMPVTTVPHIGRVEVLNGCGTPKAASAIADFLRKKNFDVKEIGNAKSWNYPQTLVVSHSKDMSVANKIGKVLKTENIILLRKSEAPYNVSVIVGADFERLLP